jgi:hypothetical protein
MRFFVKVKSKRMLFWIIGFVAFAILIYLYVNVRIMRSEPYLIAKQFLLKNNEVIYNLGAPQKFSINTFGNQHMQAFKLEGKAKFDISILGAKDNGKVIVELERKEGIWRITKGVLFLKNGNQIELRTENGRQPDGSIK